MKTRSGAPKRFRKTGTGRFKHKKAGKNHILTKMSSKRKRQLRRDGIVSPADEPRVRQQMPYA